MKNYDSGPCMGGTQAVEFFQNLGNVLDDIDVYDSMDEDFSEKYNKAMNRLKYLVRKDTGMKMKKIKKAYGKGIHSVNCGQCGTGISEAWWKFCPNCGYGISR